MLCEILPWVLNVGKQHEEHPQKHLRERLPGSRAPSRALSRMSPLSNAVAGRPILKGRCEQDIEMFAAFSRRHTKNRHLQVTVCDVVFDNSQDIRMITSPNALQSKAPTTTKHSCHEFDILSSKTNTHKMGEAFYTYNWSLFA